MIFVHDKGRMANNMLQYGHVYAWGREHGRATMSMRFAYKYPWFHICHTRHHHLANYLFAKYAAKWGLIPTVRFDTEGADYSREEQMMRDRRLILVGGWYARWYDLFLKYKPEILQLFAFDKAVESYAKAVELGLGEPYPVEMIDKINRLIEENKLYELNSDAFTMTANTPRRFTFNPVDVASRRSNYVVIKARNITPGKSFPMIVSFGSDSGKNGGFVLAISENKEEKTYIFRIGGQYKWFSENNTWIELISENDDVEVSLVMISRSN